LHHGFIAWGGVLTWVYSVGFTAFVIKLSQRGQETAQNEINCSVKMVKVKPFLKKKKKKKKKGYKGPVG
jgi:hypothetical protein